MVSDTVVWQALVGDLVADHMGCRQDPFIADQKAGAHSVRIAILFHLVYSDQPWRLHCILADLTTGYETGHLLTGEGEW